MSDDPATRLKRGWTTGACATAATKAALQMLWDGVRPKTVAITLPKGERPVFAIERHAQGPDWAEVAIEKDAGDDPDVTHGAVICARVRASDGGVVFRAGEGVGTVTKPGLPIPVGAPAINPVPRRMMEEVVADMAVRHEQCGDIEITISVDGGRALALKTWNPRLGIEGGLSILGTTGVVRPFSCAAWIASIHRGIDVAVATGTRHVAGCTGATSEGVVQKLHALPDHAMLDMGDFAGGLLKYLAKHPVERFTLGGGIGKLTKFAQGARDLHSKRAQVDFGLLGDWAVGAGLPDVRHANTALQAAEIAGPKLCAIVAAKAQAHARAMLEGSAIAVDVVVIDRAGKILGRAG
jgi:cobalt-precorrin-5B (C1)-methyltransferase